MAIANKGITKYKSKTCLCGCGVWLTVHKYTKKEGGVSYVVNDFLRGHGKRGMDGFNPELHTIRFCLCGCGRTTKFFGGKSNRFIKGHENIGRASWNKGKSFSDVSRHKMSMARLGKEPINKVPIDPSALRYLYVQKQKNALEVSQILGISLNAVKNRLHALGWSRSTKASCSSADFRDKMRTVRIRTLSSGKAIASPNKLEKMVYEVIDQIGVPYEKQHPLFNKFVVDAFFPSRRLVLEVFGRYWHELPKIRKKDQSKKRYLEKCGYAVEEIWDNEIKQHGAYPVLLNVLKKHDLV